MYHLRLCSLFHRRLWQSSTARDRTCPEMAAGKSLSLPANHVCCDREDWGVWNQWRDIDTHDKCAFWILMYEFAHETIDFDKNGFLYSLHLDLLLMTALNRIERCKHVCSSNPFWYPLLPCRFSIHCFDDDSVLLLHCRRCRMITNALWRQVRFNTWCRKA